MPTYEASAEAHYSKTYTIRVEAEDDKDARSCIAREAVNLFFDDADPSVRIESIIRIESDPTEAEEFEKLGVEPASPIIKQAEAAILAGQQDLRRYWIGQ